MNNEKCPKCGAKEKGRFGNYPRWECGSHDTESGKIVESETCRHDQPKRKKRTRKFINPLADVSVSAEFKTQPETTNE